MKLNEKEEIALLKEMYQMRESVYRKQLVAELEQTAEELDNCRDEVQMRWLQGQRQYIRKKLMEIDSAKEDLEKASRPTMSMRKVF